MAQSLEAAASARVRSMKVGFTGGFYPVPAHVPEGDAALWQLQRSVELGCNVLQLRALPEEREPLEELGRRAAAAGVELETSAPGAFQLAGLRADADARARFVRTIERAARLGMPVVRTSYGRLNVETSRFNPALAIGEHLASLVPSLREAAAVAAGAGVLLAVENHCDFTGRELAQLLDAVGSPHVGAALDTGNGYTVFCDPNDDVEALAPYAFTTHMKDMRVVKSEAKGYIPLAAFGCALGEGHVDLARAVVLLAERSPRAEGLHLIVEPGWMRLDPERDAAAQTEQFFSDSIRYLRQLQEQSGRDAR